MRIAFVWDWPPVLSQASTWEDGLAAAVKHLKENHVVNVYMPAQPGYARSWINHPYFDIIVSDNLIEEVSSFNPDVILMWGDMTRPNASPLAFLGKPMAICFAGGDVLGENNVLFDHIFVESQAYANQLQSAGANYSIAFGTNTDLFQPVEQNKVFDTIFPATFAAWKRHDLYAHATMGLNSLAVGYMYDDHEQECWQECLKLGTTILPHASARVLKYLYAASKICVVPSRSDGGSQRTVLEAMAMNLPLIITDSNKYDYAYDRVFQAEPTVESIRGYINAILDGEQEVNTRDYVVENWSHITYANAIEKELERLCS